MMPAPTHAPELSIVIPCYNEQENVEAICDAVRIEAERHAKSFEILLIDNASTDNTRAIIEDICAMDGRVRAIFNNRNYGQMRSPTYGIYQARGAAVIGMCADFQDPPALIGEMLEKWRNGAPIVLGQRRSEDSTPIMTFARNLSYKLLACAADYPVLPNVTGFGLYDRKVVDLLAGWNEPEPFFRGMLVESGYPIALIPFNRPTRAAGESKNGFASLLSFALSGLAGSAKALLRLPIILSLWALVSAVALFGCAVISLLLGNAAFHWLLAGLTTALFAILLFFLGLIGDQVRLLTERSRGVPLVVEERRVNFGKD